MKDTTLTKIPLVGLAIVFALLPSYALPQELGNEPAAPAAESEGEPSVETLLNGVEEAEAKANTLSADFSTP